MNDSSSREIAKLILNLIESDINVRAFKGFGSSQVFFDRSPTNLGKSSVSIAVEKDEPLERESHNSKKLVKISKAFIKNDL